jgi:hypothetical protein
MVDIQVLLEVPPEQKKKKKKEKKKKKRKKEKKKYKKNKKDSAAPPGALRIDKDPFFSYTAPNEKKRRRSRSFFFCSRLGHRQRLGLLKVLNMQLDVP